MYKLIIEDDEGKTTPVPIIRDEITIGRKEGNTIRLTERNVSRRHARISKLNSTLFVEDLQSHNGVKLNNERITAKVALNDGDVIVIGDYRLSIKADKADVKAGPPAPAPSIPPTSSTAATVANPTVQSPGSTAPTAAPSLAPVAHAAVKAPEKPARLIVVSSNFARQEFPIEKAAMVIGRTDDNDVVLNHRSISRHHAKIVRDGEHFHVVDLQSANGVRVNGEEYGKIELRKGDQIDLGHVRLIFVPPGQDIDIRDKIVDLDRGRSSAPLIGGILLLCLVIGAGAWWLTSRGPDAETQARELLVDVETDMQGKRWEDAIGKMSRVISNPALPSKYRDTAMAKKKHAETEKRNKEIYDRFASAGTDRLDDAIKAFGELPGDSVYKTLAQEQFDQLLNMFNSKKLLVAEKARADGRCADFEQALKAILTLSPGQLSATALQAKGCGERPSVTPSDTSSSESGFKSKDSKDSKSSSRHSKGSDSKTSEPKTPVATTTATKPPPVEAVKDAKDVDEVLRNAQISYVNGDYKQAIELAKTAVKVSPNRAWRIIGSAACNLKDLKPINDAYKKLDPPGKQYLIYVCQRNGIVLSGSQFKSAD